MWPTSWFWILLIIVIVLIIAVIIIAGSFWAQINSINTTGVGWRVQQSNGSTDIMKTGGNNWYIANTANMLIRISKDPSNTTGKEIVIQNLSSADVVVDTTQLNGYQDGTFSLGKTIPNGQIAQFIFVGNNNLLRAS